ncbi:MAG TPA: hypothetical protein VIV35_12340, partial [Chitinophagaceae bacterium]
DFDEFLKDTAFINRLLASNESLKEFSKLASKRYSIFLYSVDTFGATTMKFWSDQLITPTRGLLTAADGEFFAHLSNGWYFTIKKTLPDDSTGSHVVSYAMIPIRSEFFIETDYLPKEFVYSKTADKRVLISEKVTEFPVRSASGKILFYLDKKTSGAVPYNNRSTILLRLAGVLFLFLFVHLLAESESKRNGAWRAIGLLTLILVIFRLLTYYFPFIFNQRQFELFSPLIYGSNFVQRSLGDLLVNSILFCWIVLFAWAKLQRREKPTASFPVLLKWVTGIFSLYLLIFSTFILASVIRSFVAD